MGLRGWPRRPASLAVIVTVVLLSLVVWALQRGLGLSGGGLGLVLAPLGRTESVPPDQGAHLARLRYLEQENARLQSLLELRRTEHPRSVSARVVGRDPNGWYQQVVVDRGSDDGVSTRTVAVGPRGLLGRVSEVGSRSSRLRLLLDPQSVVPVRLSDSGATGILYGQGGYTCVVRFVSHQVEVRKGEQVFTSGLGEVYPGGLPVARVVRNYGRDQPLAQTLEVEPLADFSGLGEMLLLTRRP